MQRIHLVLHSGVVEILFQRLLDEGELFFLREDQPRVDETIMFACGDTSIEDYIIACGSFCASFFKVSIKFSVFKNPEVSLVQTKC